MDDAGALSFAPRRGFFFSVEPGEAEGAARCLAVAEGELLLVGETVDLRLRDLHLARLARLARGLLGTSHRLQLWTARGARAKAACYEGVVIVRSTGLATLAFVTVLLTMAAALAACAQTKKDSFDDGTTPAGDGGSFGQDGGKLDPTGAGEVFGHSEKTLYRVDTVTRTVTSIGDFDGCTYVADIALDESSTIYASTGSELFFVETNTARCTRIAAGKFPNSLSFVPKGTIDQDRETLVGFQGGDYVKIDTKSGAVTKIGSIGGGLESSGDIVSAKGGKTFVTVTGPSCDDCLVEVDPATGKLAKNWGSIGQKDVFGLAFWAGELYAFTNAGQLFLITLANDKLETKPIPVTNAPEKFWGAGSTTSAPTGPVR